MTSGMQDVFQEQVPNIQMRVVTVPIIEKIEKIVGVHQLQSSYQVEDVQSSRNDRCLCTRSLIVRCREDDSVTQEDRGVSDGIGHSPPMGTGHSPDRLGRSCNERQIPQAQQTERIIDITVVLLVRAPGPSHRKTMERLTKT